ncbi:MAG: hypothetical protein RLZZ584_2347 [Pseudomonadota bacterium]
MTGDQRSTGAAAGRKSGAADLIVRLLARLPWWVGAGLAGLTYLVLHGLQGVSAQVGQYLLPGLCLLAAATSVLQRRRQRAQVELEIAQHDQANAGLYGLSLREFTEFAALAFDARGYQVGESGACVGLDIELHRHGRTWLVHCNKSRGALVDVEAVRMFHEVVKSGAAGAVAGGYYVAIARFSPEAITFARKKGNLRLVDGTTLRGWVLAPVAEKLQAGSDAGLTG